MKYNNFFIIVLNLYMNSLIADQQMKEYFITLNNIKCGLLTLSADLFVDYETTEGIKTIQLSFLNASNIQSGICSTVTGNTTATFTISVNNFNSLIFNFENVNNKVNLRDVMFTNHLPNENFPDAIKNSTIVSVIKVNQSLSTLFQFYQCLSRNVLSLTNNVTLIVYGLKLKVFNVLNNSYGADMSECQQDNTSSPVSTLVSTRYTIPTTESPKTSDFTIASTSISPNDPKFKIGDGLKFCLLLQGKMTLSILYETSKKDVVKEFSVNSLIPYNGTCFPNEENITLFFGPEFYFILSFIRKEKLVKLNTFKTHICLSPQVFPDTKYPNSVHENSFTFGSTFEVELDKAFKCSHTLHFGNSQIKLETLNFEFEAFRTSNNSDFIDKEPTECSDGLTIGQIVSILLFTLTLSVLLGLSLISLIRKCARYYRYQKVHLQDTS